MPTHVRIVYGCLLPLWLNCVIVTETTRPAKPKILTIGPFINQFANSCHYHVSFFSVILIPSSHLYPRPTYQSIFLAHLPPSTLYFSFDTSPLEVLLPLSLAIVPFLRQHGGEHNSSMFPLPLCPSAQDRARDTAGTQGTY